MSKADFLKNLVGQLSDALPTHLGTLKTDFEKNCQQILKQSFEKFDLVTREEFDTQQKVLLRTRTKLDALEQQIKELETHLHSKQRKVKS